MTSSRSTPMKAHTHRPGSYKRAGDCDLSPDGRWMWCKQSLIGALAELEVVPTRDLQQPKRVVSSIEMDHLVRPAWHWAGTPREYLDSVAILVQTDTIPLGAPIQVRATGYSNLHRDIRLHALRWTSLDSTIARVDSTGTIRGVRPGRVTIGASAGGWRTTRRSFVVAELPTPTLLTEDWHEPLVPRWQLFGVPFPLVVEDSLIGRAFLNNGDGNYFSGAYRVDSPFNGHDGLALDAVVRLRITREQWQYFNLGFIGLRNVADLRKSWDHLTGYLPSRYENGSSGCIFGYPAAKDRRRLCSCPAATSIRSFRGGGGERLPDIALGVPTRVRIQVLPDGRCGFALNGVALAINPTTGPLDSLYVLTQGNSVDTRVLIGKLTVRRGVPTDVDWSHPLARR